MMRVRFLVILGVLAILGAGCEEEATRPPLTRAWIIDPEDGVNFLSGARPVFKFVATSAKPIDEFDLDINAQYLNGDVAAGVLKVDGIFQTSQGGTEKYFGQLVWITCNTPYEITLRVRAYNAGDSEPSSPWSEPVHATCGIGTTSFVTAVLTPPDLIEVIPSLEVILSPTPTVVIIYSAFALKNANCRAGPGTAHNETGFVPKSSTVEVIGRNEDGSWLKVVNPNGAGFCWASIIAFEMQNDVGLIPVDAAIPTAPSPANPEEANPEEAEPTGCMVTSPLNNQTRCESPCPPRAVPGTACTP